MLFTFPSRYWFTIGHKRVFSLTRWFWQIPTDFHLFRGTREIIPESRKIFAYETFTLYGLLFQVIRLIFRFLTLRPYCNSVWIIPTTPTDTTLAGFYVSIGLGKFFPFRSPLLRESLLFSFPPGTEMFHFPGLSLTSLCIQLVVTIY